MTTSMKMRVATLVLFNMTKVFQAMIEMTAVFKPKHIDNMVKWMEKVQECTQPASINSLDKKVTKALKSGNIK